MATNCNFVPSLERMACQTLAASLWSHDAILSEISECKLSRGYRRREDKWKELEEDIADMAESFSLPEVLKSKLLCFIKPIGLQLLVWINYLAEEFNFDEAPLNFHWSPLGTIDRRKTAEILVKDETIDLHTRFEIACTFCLESDISRLWEELDETFKNMASADMKYQSSMVSYWVYCMRKEVVPDDIFELYRMFAPNYDMSIYALGFVYSLEKDSRSACMYFLEKITDQERHKILRDTIRRYCIREFFSILPSSFVSSLCKDTLCFLILSMDGEHLMELFTVHDIDNFPSKILKYFLCWPFQELFLGMMEKTKDLCSVEDYFDLLSINLCSITEGYEDYNYELCFSDIWQRVPSNLKINAVRQNLLFCTLGIYDNRLFNLILQSLPTTDKQTFISDPSGEKVVRKLIRKQNWEILEFVFTECVVSQKSIGKVRKQCERLLNSLRLTEEKKKSAEHRIFTCLDDIALKLSSSTN